MSQFCILFSSWVLNFFFVKRKIQDFLHCSRVCQAGNDLVGIQHINSHRHYNTSSLQGILR